MTGITPAQDAELGLRFMAKTVAESVQRVEETTVSQELLLSLEAHRIGVANLLEKAADYIRDELAPKEQP